MFFIQVLDLESSRPKIVFFLRFIKGVKDGIIFVQGYTPTFIRTPTIIKNREAGTPLLLLAPLLLLGTSEYLFFVDLYECKLNIISLETIHFPLIHHLTNPQHKLGQYDVSGFKHRP